MSDRELIISSATIVQPGDKVLLVLPADVVNSVSELAECRARLEEWAPGVDWIFIAGPSAVIHLPAERPTKPVREIDGLPLCSGADLADATTCRHRWDYGQAPRHACRRPAYHPDSRAHRCGCGAAT